MPNPEGKRTKKATKGTKPKTKLPPSSRPLPQLTNANKAPKSTVNQKPSVPPPVKEHALNKVCSLTNPFCIRAQNARLPDGSGAQTFTTRVHQIINMPNTNAGGFAALVITPYGFINSFTGASSTLTMGTYTAWTNVGAGSMASNWAQRIRVNSFGVILRSAGNSTNMQGNVIVSNPSTVGAGAVVTPGNYLSPNNETFAIGTGWQVCAKGSPINNMVARQFVPFASFQTTSDAVGWETLLIEFIGAAAAQSTYITAEVFVNVEYTLIPESTLAPFLPPPTPVNHQIVEAVDKTHTKAPLAVVGGPDAFDTLMKGIANIAVNELGKVGWAELAMGLLAF